MRTKYYVRATVRCAFCACMMQNLNQALYQGSVLEFVGRVCLCSCCLAGSPSQQSAVIYWQSASKSKKGG